MKRGGLPRASASWWTRAGGAVRWRPDLAALVGLAVLALLLRLAFSFRAPPFVTNDSLSYLLPGVDLVHGDGFSPILKRPPLYPWFVGGVLWLFGEELRALVLVQHLLGVVTVLLSYGLGRALFGTAGGVLGGLLTALSGPLIITEHYLMSESLFTLLLLGGMLAYLVAGYTPHPTQSGFEKALPPSLTAGLPSPPPPLPHEHGAPRLRHSPRQGERGDPRTLSGIPLFVKTANSHAGSPSPAAGRGGQGGRGVPGVRGALALAGLLFGLAALTRPIAQLVVLLLAAALLLLLPRWRAALLGIGVLLGMFAVTVLPWMLRNAAVQGTFQIAGGSGEGLAVRTIRYDQKFDFREPPGGDSDRTLQRARRIYRDEAGDGSAFELARRLREELGVSEIEAERLMRTIALQAIVRAPGYYLQGTASMFLETFAGNRVRLRQDWLPWRGIVWEPRVQHLLPAPTAVEERSFGVAERLVTLYDPARLALLVIPLMLVGTLAGLRAEHRLALLVGGVVLVVLVAGAALIGIEYRYRYPLDPLINVLAAGGLLTLLGVARTGWRRWAPACDAAPVPATGTGG